MIIGRAVGDEPARRGRAHPAFGTGPLLLATAALLLLCLLRTPLRWSGAVLAVVASLWAVIDAAARCAGRRRRAGRGRARRRRPARGPAQRPRHFRDQGMAGRRRRCAHAKDASLHDGVALRRRRLHRPTRRRPAGVAWRCRRRPSPRIARAPPWWSARARRRAHCAAAADRPQGVARQRRDGAALDRRSFRAAAPRGRPATSGPGRAGPRSASERRNRCRCAPAARDATPRAEDLEAGD